MNGKCPKSTKGRARPRNFACGEQSHNTALAISSRFTETSGRNISDQFIFRSGLRRISSSAIGVRITDERH